MPDLLIIYASKHGHTAKVARRIADTAAAAGAAVHLHEATSPESVAPADYDGVIVGASIHAGRHQREIVDWARAHHATLNGMPSAFFSVCLTAADDSDESRQATRRYIDELVEATGWTPSRTTTFAGALQYREYDFATRLLVRLIMRRAGHSTDVSKDHDYTDWDAVERFAREATALVARKAVAGDPHDPSGSARMAAQPHALTVGS